MTSTATKQTQNDSQSSNNANEQSDSLPQNSDSNANSNSNPSSNSNTTPASTNGNEQELIDIGVVSDKDSRKRHLREAVDSGALPMSALVILSFLMSFFTFTLHKYNFFSFFFYLEKK